MYRASCVVDTADLQFLAPLWRGDDVSFAYKVVNL